MCFDERWTESRSLEPAADLTARRTRAWRRATAFRCCAINQSPSFLLAFLAEDVLVAVFHALALVGLRRTESVDLGRDLADLLLVDPGHDDLGRSRRHDRDAVRDRIADLVAEAEQELQVLALNRRAIAHPADLQPTLESLGDARHQVVDERAGQAPHRPRPLGLRARRDRHAARLHARRNIVVEHDFERALGPLPRDRLALDAR